MTPSPFRTRRRSLAPAFALILAIALLPPAHAAPEAPADPAQTLQDQATAAFERKDYAAARDALTGLLAYKSDNAAVLYNLACALAQTGEIDAAGERLLDAITHGFVDFFHMEADAHLRPLAGSRAYEAVLLGWRELLDARADSNFESAKRAFGPPYHFARNPQLRLIYAAAFDEQTFAEAEADINAVAEWALATLFTDMRLDDPAAPEPDPRPDPWVTVILPTPEDFVRMIRSANVGGFYDHDQRRLISQDVGPSLRHEFLHVLHWRHMMRHGQKHPEWVMEGLGCLVEDIERSPAPEGSLTPAPSWRTNIVKRLERAGRLLPLDELTSMPRERFVTRRPNAHYAQARAIMLHMALTGRLGAWYGAYVRSFDRDPTGSAALEEAFGMPLREIDRAHKEWVRALPEVAEEIRPGMASLGVVVTPGRGDGPAIESVLPGSDARRAGLRMGDVIVAVDGRPTRTMEDLVKILSEREVGERVEVSVRRGTRRVSTSVTLVAAD